MTKKTVLLALIDSHLRAPEGNAPFSIGALPVWSLLGRALEDRGFDFRIVDKVGSVPQDAVVLWDFASMGPPPPDLRSSTCRVIAWTLESPLVAHRAFHRIDEVARAADLVLSFPGTAALMSREDRFRPILWPVKKQTIRATSWEGRRGVVLIASNKTVKPSLSLLDVRKPQMSARRMASALVSSSYSLRRSWTLPDLYLERLRLAASLSSSVDVDLFGPGWERYRGPEDIRAFVGRSYRGFTDDKLVTLGRYRFCICFENTRFPGYITEKIFDCFVAGVVPIYLGAPDVGAYIPPDCFIDGASMPLERLVEAISRIGEEEWQAYRSAAEHFLWSTLFDRFSEENFIDVVCAAVQNDSAA